MTGTEWLVVLGAITAIAWVNWYFFVAGRASATAAVAMPTAAGGGAGIAGAIAEVVIEVDGGYSPNAVRVKAGEPVRLVFDRKDESSCSEEVVIPAFGIRTYLPTGQRTTIEITPEAAGKYGFMCGMSMLRGTIIAED
jgi:plastocyanin domain-containing protein